MKDRLPLCHRLGFLETDSAMEICVQIVPMGRECPREQYLDGVSDRGGRAGQREKLGSVHPLGATRIGATIQSCHKTGIRSGFKIPFPPFSLPLSLGWPNDLMTGRRGDILENTTPFRLGAISWEALGCEPMAAYIPSSWADYLSPGRGIGATYHRIDYTLYFTMRKIESDKNLGIETEIK